MILSEITTFNALRDFMLTTAYEQSVSTSYVPSRLIDELPYILLWLPEPQYLTLQQSITDYAEGTFARPMKVIGTSTLFPEWSFVAYQGITTMLSKTPSQDDSPKYLISNRAEVQAFEFLKAEAYYKLAHEKTMESSTRTGTA